MKKILIVVFIVLALGGYIFYNNYQKENTVNLPPIELPEETSASENFKSTGSLTQTTEYKNKEYNFSFKYRVSPTGYSIFNNSNQQNLDLGTLAGVTLVRTDDYNESVKSAEEGNAHDGPPAISVSVFAGAKVSDLPLWLEDHKMMTNCEMGTVLATVIDGKDASSCLWDGLYPGITAALLHNNKIYLLTGTREEGETEGGFTYKKDFDEVFESFSISSIE